MIYQLPNESFLKVHDIFDNLPDFMFKADTLFIDPPYNQNLLTNFSNRENVSLSEKNNQNFNEFIECMFKRISEIKAKTCFIEIGKTYLPEFYNRLKSQYKYVTFYNSFYYNDKKNKCYILHGTNDFKTSNYKLDDIDESKIIEWICKNHDYNCIGDLCMGKGLVGKNAFINHKSFVGIDINQDRLNVLIDYVSDNYIMLRG